MKRTFDLPQELIDEQWREDRLNLQIAAIFGILVSLGILYVVLGWR